MAFFIFKILFILKTSNFLFDTLQTLLLLHLSLIFINKTFAMKSVFLLILCGKMYQILVLLNQYSNSCREFAPNASYRKWFHFTSEFGVLHLEVGTGRGPGVILCNLKNYAIIHIKDFWFMNWNLCINYMLDLRNRPTYFYTIHHSQFYPIVFPIHLWEIGCFHTKAFRSVLLSVGGNSLSQIFIFYIFFFYQFWVLIFLYGFYINSITS